VSGSHADGAVAVASTRPRRPPRGALARAALVAAFVLGLGALLGLVWWALAPLARADVVDGQVYLTGHTELQAAQDGWFAIVTGVAGVLAATVLSLRPGRGEVTSAALGPVLGLVVAVVAWRTGALLGPPSLAHQLATGSRHPLTPMQLHGYGALFVGPLLFALTRFLAALFGSEPRD
jgi:hypothetical protein